MYPQPLRLAWHCVRNKPRKIASSPSVILSMRVRILLSPRARVQRITSGIRAILSCSLSISCSSPSPASQQPQPVAAAAPAAPAHSSPETGSSSSEAASSPRNSPPVARHVRRAVSALGRLEHAASADGRACRGRAAPAGGGRDRCRGGKGVEAGSSRAGSSQGGGGSSGGGAGEGLARWRQMQRVRQQLKSRFCGAATAAGG